MKKSLLLLISIYSLCLLSACGGGGAPPPPPPVATHFSVAPATSTPTAGTPFNITVTALGASGQTATSYSGSVHFTSTDGQAVLPADAPLVNGTGVFSATLKTVGIQTITATDTVTASISGATNSITVSAVVATHFSVTTPPTVTAGSAFSFVVNALDASDGVVTGYSGTVHFKSTDPQADLAPNSIVMNGTAAFPAALKTLGKQTITATDTVTASITGTSNSIDVSTAAAASPVPFLNQPLSPDAIVPGGAAFKLTVNGTGFASGALVEWNGSPRTTNFASDSQLTANILLTDIANFNTAAVRVVNPAPGGGGSNVAFFETTKPTSSVSWSITSSLATASGPSSVATADFNGDGKLDMVVTNGGSNNISIILGNGNGTFLAAVNYPTSTNPDAVEVGDFNGDGKLDLAVANFGSNNISILLGNGDGTFLAAANYPTGTNPSSIAVGDFNGDGKLDLAVENSGSSNVSILLGNGDGTFQAALDFGAGLTLGSMAVGDFNGDGELDLVVGLVNSISIFLGNGDGTFQSGVEYLAGSNSSSVAVGDLNGDGKLDLAIAHGASTVGGGGIVTTILGNVTILLGNGDGTFQAPVQYSVDSFADSSPVMGDFNGDDKLDLAVANGNSVSILLGNGDGTFQPALDYAAGLSPLSLAVGDFNGDGRLDMAVADQPGSTVSVLLQPGLTGPNATLSPTFLTFATQLVGTTSTSQSVTLSNNGTAALNITSMAATTNFSETDNCGSSLLAGASCTINVTFVPNGGGNLTGTLSITDNAPGSPQTATLNGVGTVAELVPDAMFFSCTGSCQSQTATLTNKGATALGIHSITITSNKQGVGGHVGFAQTNNCGTSLGAGLSCSITVKFIGSFNFRYVGALIVQDSDGSQELPLHGFLNP